ncbi:MAG: NADH-quinone oxidoreductase subunit NuoG [Thermodesulfobacteriota bacterium]|nr:MAG: NADH-quinone oxidoreductase subunit NuoG [Thermodesulfobacteriota bacterium]
MVTITINGQEITVDDGTLILEAARGAGFDIPTFCYQADLMGIGSCRMCLVEIEGQKKLQPSCITPVIHDMKIHTDTPSIVSARAGVLEFFLSNHALDCPVCDKGGECELQDAVHKHGPRHGRFGEVKHRFHDKDYILSPVIVKNSNRCVQCQKCVRVCSEVVGAGVLGSLGRGYEQEETSFLKNTLDCDHCGNCIEVCPVGCFMRLPYRYKSRPWDLKGADTICPYCATGCRMVIEERDGTVMRARGQLGVGINSETLCARGRFGYDFINSHERITKPLIRKYGKLEPVTWEEAFEYVKDNLSRIDGEKIGGIASARLTNEELYLFQKLFRTVLSSPNLDSSTRWDAAAVENFISAADMTGGGTSVFDCMEADTVLVTGTQLSEENPIIDYIVRRISATRPINVVVASPRGMKLDKSAHLSIRHTPGNERAFLDAVTLSVLSAVKEAPGSVAGISRLRGVDLEALLSSAGVSAEEVDALAKKLLVSESVSIIAGTGFLRYPEGSAGLGLLREVLKALGKEVRVLPVLDRCNQRGAWEMGVLPGTGPGYGGVDKRGLGFYSMMEGAAKKEIEALYIIDSDVLGDYHDESSAMDALNALKFLVVQDEFMTATAEMAHCVLPGATFSEKDGTFSNQEGRVQRIRRLSVPPGKARSGLEIIAGIGKAFTPSFVDGARVSSLSVFDEIRQEIPMYSDVSLVFNNKKNTENKLDNREALIKDSGRKIVPPAVEPERPEEEGGRPFMLVTGNHLFSSGRLSTRSAILGELLKGPIVEISEADAAELGLNAGEKVRVKGERFEAVLPLMTNKGTKKGVAFIPENFCEAPVARFFTPGGGVPRVSISRA